MTEFGRFLLLGLGSGAIYALVALGIVLVYRGSGVVNFANGALSLTGAAVYVECLERFGTAIAMVIGIGAAALAGLVINLGVMTPLRKASPLTRVIATLGLLSLGSELWKHRLDKFGVRPVEPIFPSGPVQPFGHGLIISEDRLWLLGTTVAMVALLWVIYRTTRFGFATTAVAENEAVAAAQGWSPTTIASINWMLGGALAGFAGIMLSTITGLSVTSQTTVIVPALAAALIGGFASFPLTLAGGLLVGVLESEALNYASPTGYSKGLSTSVPFFLIVLILVARGKALPLRNFLADRLPSIGSARINPIAVAVILPIVVGSLWIFSTNYINAVITSAVMALVALSLVVVAGYAGQLSLTQWTMAGMGALFAGRLAGDVWGLPYPLAVLVGILITIPAGVLVSLPALRVRGASLAVTSLALGYVLSTMVLGNDAYTGGPLRGTIVDDPTLFGWSLRSVKYPERYAAVSVCLVALGALMVANLRRGRSGRRLIAVRDNERAAASMGIGVLEAKVFAFAVSSVLAAAGGTIIAFRNPNLDYSRFDLFGNINAVLFATIGGIGWIAGGIVGGLIASGGLVSHTISHYVSTKEWYPAIAALVLVATVIQQPHGVMPKLIQIVQHLLRRLRPTTVGEVPTAAAERVAIERVVPMSLEMRDVTVRFGGIVAVHDVSLVVSPGEVVGLIGPNGAGKTTLIEAATGFVPCTGSVMLDGKSVTKLSATARSRRGLTRSFQSLELFEDLSVRDNLRIACDDGGRGSYIVDLFRPRRQDLSAPARAAVAEFELGSWLDKKPSELPYATRRLVAIARAVASAPSVLLLDEPAAGLDEASTAEMAHLIKRLAKDWGMAVLLIEHDVALVMRTCDRIYALRFGEVIASGSPNEVRNHRDVIESYLGAPVESDACPEDRTVDLVTVPEPRS
jgi:ABC-type branched-subunit amino acid transport system ATPase component/branched-subunit amino acid ABC-type transport system permease component